MSDKKSLNESLDMLEYCEKHKKRYPYGEECPICKEETESDKDD